MQERVPQARAAMRDGVRQAGMETLLFHIAQASRMNDIIRILHDDYGTAAQELSWKVFGLDSGDYYVAKAHAYYGEPKRARAYHDSAAAWAAPRVKRGESQPGFSYAVLFAREVAGSGRRSEAIPLINRFLVDSELVWFPEIHEYAAEACVLAGEYDCAIEQIRLAMADPSKLTPSLLRVDPIWDPLRARADFKELAGRQ